MRVCVLEGKQASWASLLVCGLRLGGCNGARVCVSLYMLACVQACVQACVPASSGVRARRAKRASDSGWWR